MTPVLISVDELARMCGVGRTKAYDLLKMPGAPKAVPLGTKTVRYHYADALAFLQRLPTATQEEPPHLRSRRYRDGALVAKA